jgi:hypothetical protein
MLAGEVGKARGNFFLEEELVWLPCMSPKILFCRNVKKYCWQLNYSVFTVMGYIIHFSRRHVSANYHRLSAFSNFHSQFPWPLNMKKSLLQAVVRITIISYLSETFSVSIISKEQQSIKKKRQFLMFIIKRKGEKGNIMWLKRCLQFRVHGFLEFIFCSIFICFVKCTVHHKVFWICTSTPLHLRYILCTESRKCKWMGKGN